MSSIRLIVALCLVAFVAACAPKVEEITYADTAQVTVEPTFTGKYN